MEEITPKYCLVRVAGSRSTLIVETNQVFLARKNSTIYDVPATVSLLKKARNGAVETLKIFVGKAEKIVTVAYMGGMY